jgi:hypothetical protein
MALVAAQLALPFIQANPKESKKLGRLIKERTGVDISEEEIDAGVDFIAGSQEQEYPEEPTEETTEETEEKPIKKQPKLELPKTQEEMDTFFNKNPKFFELLANMQKKQNINKGIRKKVNEEEQEGGKRISFKVSNPMYILATTRKYMYLI